jgi:hypothetical protein
MPDDADYQELGELLAHPERWTDEDVASVRFMIANQQRAVAGMHPKDGKGRRSAQSVVAELEAALQTYLSRRRS